MEKYTKARSNIAKNLIKQTDFNNRDKIDGLLELKSFIINDANTYNSKAFF